MKPPQSPAPPKHGSPALLSLDLIRPSAENPRKTFAEEPLAELAESIRQHGILEPLLVRPTSEGDYELVAGERRYRAAQQAGLRCVPVMIREDLDDQTAVVLRLVENLQREDLNPVEEAAAYQLLLDQGLSRAEVAAQVGKLEAAVNRRLYLLDLPERVQARIRAGELSASHGERLRWLRRLPDADRLMERYAERAIREGLSADRLSALLQELTPAPAPLSPTGLASPTGPEPNAKPCQPDTVSPTPAHAPEPASRPARISADEAWERLAAGVEKSRGNQGLLPPDVEPGAEVYVGTVTLQSMLVCIQGRDGQFWAPQRDLRRHIGKTIRITVEVL